MKPNQLAMEQLIERYELALMRHFAVIEIKEGGTLKTRKHTHIFVPGKVYGGRVGATLCRTPFKRTQVWERSNTKIDLCKRCSERIRRMAILLANKYPRLLFQGVSDKNALVMTGEQVSEAFSLLMEWEMRAKTPKQEQAQLPSEYLPEGTGRRLGEWKPINH